MIEAKDWLSLKIQKSLISGRASSLLISIPKKTVRLATERNRIKRLIREAFRKADGLDPEKIYSFRVVQNPGELKLETVREIVARLIYII